MSSSSSSSNKRPRISSTSKDPTVGPRQPNYFSFQDFVKTEETDLLSQSCDGYHFAVQKVHLSVASTIFRDTLLVGSDESSDRVDSLPVLELEEEAFVLVQLLPFLQPSPVVTLPQIKQCTDLNNLLQVCDKYDAPHTRRNIFNQVCPQLLDFVRDDDEEERNELQNLFALSLIAHSRFKTGRQCVDRAIRMMGVRGVWDDEIDIPIIAHSIEGEKIPTTRIGWRPFNIFDIPPSYYDRMNRDHVRMFLVTREAVLTEVDYCWREAAEDFEL